MPARNFTLPMSSRSGEGVGLRCYTFTWIMVHAAFILLDSIFLYFYLYIIDVISGFMFQCMLFASELMLE